MSEATTSVYESAIAQANVNPPRLKPGGTGDVRQVPILRGSFA
jgi:hypothetical protein